MDRGASRLALPLAVGILGFLAVLAAADPRIAPGRDYRRLELVDLIAEQDARVRDLQADVRSLEQELERVGESSGVRDGRIEELRDRAQGLAVFAGNAALEGPGVVVTLDDSTSSRSPSGDPNDLVVHEEDIQTVVNALWSAGAEAIAVNGERLSSLSAVRCAGNTLLLHGRLHSPPYAVAAVGEPEAITAALPGQPGMDRWLGAVASFGLGYEVETRDRVLVPAGATSLALARARPA
jgi:uncharacterized protein YlxW (UPF0749 family)